VRERLPSKGPYSIMKTAPTLYWIEGPWTGRLAISARPRGWDWLQDDVAARPA
jgi:hypothetical protein